MKRLSFPPLYILVPFVIDFVVVVVVDVVEPLSNVQLFVTLWTVASQASLSFSVS